MKLKTDREIRHLNDVRSAERKREIAADHELAERTRTKEQIDLYKERSQIMNEVS
jgi:hypothetical protein